MAKKSLIQKIKDFFTGGNKSSKSTKSSSSGGSKSSKASSTSYYGGGGSYSGYTKSQKKKEDTEEQKQARQQLKQKMTTDSLASISNMSKRTDTLSSGVKMTPPTERTPNGVSRVLSKIEQKSKASVPDPKQEAMRKSQERSQERKEKRKAEIAEFHKATGNKYNTKTGDEAHDRKAYALRVGGYGNASPEVQKHSVEYHPTITSAARGISSGVTFGGTEFAISRLAKTDKEREEAEKYYQEHKNRLAEGAGELAGSLVSFGGVGKMAEKGVSKALGTEAGEKAIARLAERKGVQKAATRSLERAAKKKGLTEAGEVLTKEAIEKLAKDKVRGKLAYLGENLLVDATAGTLYDFNNAASKYEVGSPEFWDEMKQGVLFNVGAGALGTGGRRIFGGNKAAKEAIEQLIKNGEGGEEAARKLLRGNLKVKGKAKPLINNVDEAVEETVKSNAVAEAADDALRPRLEDVETVPPKLEDVETSSSKPRTVAEAREQMKNKADEKADAIRAFLGEEPKADVPKAEAKVDADVEAPKTDTDNEAVKAFNAQEESKRNYTFDEEGNKVYTVKIKRTTAKGKDVYVKATVKADSEAEALAKATNRRTNVKQAVVVEPKGVKAETPPPKAQTRPPQEVDDIHKMVNNKREEKSLKDSAKAFVDSAKTKFANSLDAFEKWNKQFLKTDFTKWKRGVGAIDKVRRFQAIAARSIKDGQLGANGKVIKDSKSLMQIYEGLDEAAEKDFDLYLLLKHSPDRVKEGKPIFGTIADGKNYDDAEVCAEEAKRLRDKYLEKGIDLEERANDIYKYLRNELQNRVDAGLTARDVADKWNDMYKFYVPTGRTGKNGAGDIDIWDAIKQFSEGGNVTGAGDLKGAVGDNSPIRSIKEQIAEATTRNWRDMSMNNLFKTMFDDKVAEALAKEVDGGLETVLDHSINLGSDKSGRYFADVFDNGEKVRIEIDKPFYDAIEDLYKNGRLGNDLDVAADFAQKIAHPFKELITSWSPFFLVKNFMRDFPEAIINTRQTKEFMECMIPAAKDLAEGGEFSQALRNAGVSQSNFVNLDEALIKNDNNFIKKGLNKFATANEATEMYPRLVEFMATIKKAGYDSLDAIPEKDFQELIDYAAANAADVTVNFGRSGSVGKMLNRGFVPFLNPSIQGWSKFIRNITEAENPKALLGLVLKATALGATPTIINNYLLKDNPNYQMISARDKANNYIIPIPKSLDDKGLDEADMFIKIPRSRFASVYGLPAVNVANENKMGWAEMLKVTNDQIAPVNPFENNLAAPIAAVAKNETWYGTPIVSQGIENKTNPSQEYDANTSYLGRGLGKLTENLPTKLQISPKKADYLIDAYTGIAGDVALPALTPSRRGGGGAIAGTASAVGNVAKRQFTIDPTTQNDLSTRFYNEMQKASDNSKIGSKKAKAEYTRLNSYSDDISNLNQAIKHLQGGNSKTKQEDIYALQKVRNQLMQDALDGKGAPISAKTMDAVQKHVGTTYAIDKFGSTADKNAMKVYGIAKYGELSDEAMQKKIDADKGFYKGVQSIGNLTDKMTKAGIKSDTVLSKAVALASAGADDDLFGAYEATKKSRTESDNKMNRARTYFKDGGSEDEYVQLEKARKTLGKLTDYDKEAELDKIDKQLARGEISLAEYHSKEDSINYNANISYIGLATSLAQANAPERGYRLYDIKDKNIQKGINLAAMGYTARDYREMSKALDTDGNGYPSKKEITAYVANSDVADKATLFDALYYYQGKNNPFGTPTNYTREQAAEAGKSNGIKSISNENGEFKLDGETSSSSGYSGYRRYGGYYRHYGHGGSSKKAKVPAPKTIAASKFIKGEALVSQKKKSSSTNITTPTLKRVEAKIDLPTVKSKKR